MYALNLNKPSVTEVMLSQRENEILYLLSDGLSNKEIADKLFISEFTVQTHRRNMLKKMGFRNFYQMICWAIKQGVLVL